MIDSILNMDCMAGLKDIPDKSVDLVVTDPPYDVGYRGSGFFGVNRKHHFDRLEGITSKIMTDVLDECLRVLKCPNLYIWCNKDQIYPYLDYFNGKGVTMDLLTWHKTNPTPLVSNHYLTDTEYCLFFKKDAKLFGNYHTLKKYWITTVNSATANKAAHPTMKPLDIIKTMVTNSSQGGGTVLDPFMGSGTTAVACKLTGRHYIGFEIDPKYCEIANERVKNTKVNEWF